MTLPSRASETGGERATRNDAFGTAGDMEEGCGVVLETAMATTMGVTCMGEVMRERATSWGEKRERLK